MRGTLRDPRFRLGADGRALGVRVDVGMQGESDVFGEPFRHRFRVAAAEVPPCVDLFRPLCRLWRPRFGV